MKNYDDKVTYSSIETVSVSAQMNDNNVGGTFYEIAHDESLGAKNLM